MQARILALTILIIGSLGTTAQYTWSDNVGQIVFDHCSRCHHQGGIGPFTLMSYEDAYNWRFEIEAAVSEGNMPPWPADPNYRHFAFENVLSVDEKTALLDWIANDAPHGNEANDPEPPVFQEGSQLPSVDMTAQMPLYTSTAADEDVYRSFVIPSGLTEDKYIDMMEVIPGNSSIVHHVLIYYDPTNASALLDAADPGPGFSSNGTGMTSDETVLLGGWVPGSDPMFLPEGFGHLIEAGSDIIIEVHYPEGSDGQTDETLVNFHFSTAPFVRPVFMNATLYHFPPVLQEPILYIPADDTATFHQEYTVPLSVTLFSVLPHMHLIGRTITCWAEDPDGNEIPIIHIPEWDFHWQMNYRFPQLQAIPAGTVLKAEAFYDNTLNNPHNPSDPPEPVWVGESTTDEMMLVFFAYTIYFSGDEDIVVDPALSVDGVSPFMGEMALYPNPASDQITVSYAVPRRTVAILSICDMQGRELYQAEKTLKAGMDHFQTDVSWLPRGNYVMRLAGESILSSKTFVVQH